MNRSNPWISDLHWVREGSQDRSRRTQETLIDAAAQLLAEKGADATSVTEIAERAGLSVGALYHHFRDKRALLYAVFQRCGEQLEETIARAVDPARWEGASIDDILRGYLEFTLESGRESPGFEMARIEASLHDPDLRERLSEIRKGLSRGLTALLLARRAEIGHPDPELAVAFALEQLGSLLRTRHNSTDMMSLFATRSDEEFVREALRAAGAYLMTDRERKAAKVTSETAKR